MASKRKIDVGEAGAVAAEWRPIGWVKRWKRNPRVNAHVVPKVAASIEAFGFAAPLLCRPDGTLIAGDTRYQAAQSLGLATVPVRIMEGLTDAQAAALAVADNKIAEKASWSDGLTELLRELDSILPAEDERAMGFDDGELAKLLRGAAFKPGSEDEQGKLHMRVEVQCPACGHRFARK